MAKRHALTDGQWEVIRDLLPGKAGDPGRSGEDTGGSSTPCCTC